MSVKSVPNLFWSSPRPLNLQPRFSTLAFLVAGLALFGFGEALILKAMTGLSPWLVLAQGVGNVTGWSVGFATFVISIVVLAIWIPLRQVPGIGTIANAVIIALMIEYTAPFLPTPDLAAMRVAQTVVGTYIVGFGGAMYLISNLGPGPRDGLMTGLQRVTGMRIAWVRCIIEISVVVGGWSLGGAVGAGTVIFALLIGPAVAANLYLLASVFGNSQMS